MIRVGGGWDTLEHYLDRHDPCRCNFQGKDFFSCILTEWGINVQHKVRIGSIPELYLRIPEIRIPESYRTILELRKGYFNDFCYHQALRKVGMVWTK